MVQLYQHCKQHAIPYFSILLGLLLLATLTNSARQWQRDWTLIQQNAAITEPADAHANTDLTITIPAMHLFGASLTQTGALPISNLELRVTGIVNTTQNSAASPKAYLSIEGQPSKIYRPGDALPDGVKIYALTDTAVILENHGQLEKLPLPRKSLQFKPRNIED